MQDAVAAGINLLDVAPRYGDGKAEEVVGEAFGGRLPSGSSCTRMLCRMRRIVLGVKNRRELAACVVAAETGPLSIEEMAKIDRTVASAPDR